MQLDRRGCGPEARGPTVRLCIPQLCVAPDNIHRIMAPNTMHAVWTMENSICHGGHFYSIPTLLKTAIGVIHAFIGEALLTNTDHADSRFLLRKMVHFFHHSLVVRNILPTGDRRSSSSKQDFPLLTSVQKRKLHSTTLQSTSQTLMTVTFLQQHSLSFA